MLHLVYVLLCPVFYFQLARELTRSRGRDARFFHFRFFFSFFFFSLFSGYFCRFLRFYWSIARALRFITECQAFAPAPFPARGKSTYEDT